VVGAKAVAGAAAQARDVGAEQFDAALLRQGDAAEQAEQVLLPLPLGPWRKTRSPAASSRRGISRQFCACRGQRKTRSVIRSAVMDQSLPGEHRVLRRQPLLALARGAGALGFEAVEAFEAFEDCRFDTFECGGIGAAEDIVCVDVGMVSLALMGLGMKVGIRP
jgi:hypothetical protein